MFKVSATEGISKYEILLRPNFFVSKRRRPIQEINRKQAPKKIIGTTRFPFQFFSEEGSLRSTGWSPWYPDLRWRICSTWRRRIPWRYRERRTWRIPGGGAYVRSIHRIRTRGPVPRDLDRKASCCSWSSAPPPCYWLPKIKCERKQKICIEMPKKMWEGGKMRIGRRLLRLKRNEKFATTTMTAAQWKVSSAANNSSPT